MAEMTKWEVYHAELESGHLQWGILHTTEFFRENARKMEGKRGDFAPLKRLVQILRQATSSHSNVISSAPMGNLMNHPYYSAPLPSSFSFANTSGGSSNYDGFSNPSNNREAIFVENEDDESLYERVAIACFDIGEFVRHYPNGRAIAKRVGAKQAVLPLLDHPQEQIQREALHCLSKLLVQNWEAALRNPK